MNISKILICMLIVSSSCKNTLQKDQELDETYQWKDLIDDQLSQWDNYLSFKLSPEYDGSAPKNDLGESIEPIGLNKDDFNVFSTLQEEGNTLVRISGEYYGALTSKEEFENYHLQLKYKWGDKKWIPRENKLKDSGLLYHCIGDHGAEFWRSWMLSQEFQIMEGHTGDYWSQASSAIDVRAYQPEGNLDPMAHPSQDYLPLTWGGPYGLYCLRSTNNEKPMDEWNTLELICFEGKSLHIVNDEVVMILKDSRYTDQNGQVKPLTKGKIQLQSEAAEIFFKDIRVRKIDSLDRAYQLLF